MGLLVASAGPGRAQVSEKPADSAEMLQIYDADQKDREDGNVAGIDWSVVGPRDAARRKRVSELLLQGKIVTGKDYERAAFVYQHGDTSDDILMAHVLAVTSIGKGNLEARWIAAAALDRFLHRVGQPQIFGTQFTTKNLDAAKPDWTMEPYNRTLLSPALREANCVPDLDYQQEVLKAIQTDSEPPPGREPCESRSR
jgi:hypothetical protein